MKILRKELLLVFCFLFFSVLNLKAQPNTPFIGYDRVGWGSSVETIIQTFPGINERNSENASIGIREFSQINIGGGISERIFYFYQNKLYKVLVNYNESDAETVNMILDRYGLYGGNEEHNRKLISFKNIDKISYFKKDGLNINQLNKKLEENLSLVITLESFDRNFDQFNFNLILFDDSIQKKIDEIL